MSASSILVLNPELCVRVPDGNPYRLNRKWRPLPGATTRAVASMADPVAWVPGSSPARSSASWGRAGRWVAWSSAVLLCAVVAGGVIALDRVQHQRVAYRMSMQLRQAEQRNRELAMVNRAMNGMLALQAGRGQAGMLQASAARPRVRTPGRI
ncbi:MAG TPA: hypothetical protein PKM73_07870 [Verrucomicrobiota bacterium]|nr:hypothetical protein [Verrucomicrobiota bacterium]HNU51748.1 hypothetical protein [Verrucomicrobiota bacterium]